MKTESVQALFVMVFAFALLCTQWTPFYYIDPFFWLFADGEWQRVDTIEYLIAAAVLLGLAWRIQPGFALPRSLVIAWIVYVLATAFANSWAVMPKMSWKAWGLDAVLPGALMCFAASSVKAGGLSRTHWRVLASLVVALVTWRALVHVSDLPSVLDPVLFSTLLTLFMPACMIGMLADTKDRRLCLLLLLWGMSLVLALQIRIVWLVIPMQMLVICWYGYTQQWQARQYLRWLLLLSLSLGLYRYASLYKPADWRQVATAAAAVNGVSTEGSWWQVFFKTERYRIWSFWLEQGMKSPWVGVGMGWETPARVYARFKPDDLLPIFVSHGHNVFMNRFLQSGIIGLAAFAAWVLVLVRVAIRIISKIRNGQNIGVFLVLMCVMFLFRNLPDDGMRGLNMVLFWGLIGAGMGCADRMNTNKSSG